MNPISSNVSNIHQDESIKRQELFDKVKEAFTPESKMTDEEKSAYDKKVYGKFKMGKKLTQKELDYIRRTNPQMYMHVKRVQMQRDLLDKKLHNCRSKKEVEEVYNQTVASISKKDPDKEALISAYQDVTTEFKKTSKYKRLPEKEEQDQIEKRKKEKKILFINTQGFEETEENKINFRI